MSGERTKLLLRGFHIETRHSRTTIRCHMSPIVYLFDKYTDTSKQRPRKNIEANHFNGRDSSGHIASTGSSRNCLRGHVASNDRFTMVNSGAARIEDQDESR